MANESKPSGNFWCRVFHAMHKLLNIACLDKAVLKHTPEASSSWDFWAA